MTGTCDGSFRKQMSMLTNKWDPALRVGETLEGFIGTPVGVAEQALEHGLQCAEEGVIFHTVVTRAARAVRVDLAAACLGGVRHTLIDVDQT